MQLTAFLPLLALLAAPIASANTHDGAAAAGRRHLKHVRAGGQLAKAIERREQLAQENPRAIRKVKRGANGCRARGSNFTASATTSSSSTVISSAAAATSAVTTAADSGANYVAPSSAAAAVQSSAAASASASASSSGSSSGSISVSGTSPNGKKAGVSGDGSVELLKGHIGFSWNYGAVTTVNDDSVTFVPTLWGNGAQGDQDSTRLSEFKAISYTPKYIQGFYEPDCLPPMSSAIDPYTAAALWNTVIAPWKSKGTLLVSPGMCKQADEDWLTPFKNQIGDSNMWDITSVHINKLDMAGAKKDLDHYAQYGKPIWVTEFALVDDANGFTPVNDQAQINQYINDIVDLLENDSRVAAYSMSEGEGLAELWAPVKDGQLTESGRTYLNAISKYN